MTTSTRCLGLFLSILTFSGTALAEPPAAILAASCANCHGVQGHSEGAIPSIAGLDEASMISLMKNFQSDKLEATIMNRIAKGYTDAEIAALAKYFATENQ